MKPYKCECGGWVVRTNYHSHKCKRSEIKPKQPKKTKKEVVSKYTERYGLDDA